MRFISRGTRDGRPLIMVHGLASSAELCFSELAYFLEKDFRLIFCELDGHYPSSAGEFQTISDCCREIEEYAEKELHGVPFDAMGFSLGATIVMALVSRGRAPVRRLALDAPIVISPRLFARPLAMSIAWGVQRLKMGKAPPRFLVKAMMGDTDSATRLFYRDVSVPSVQNACRSLSAEKIPPSLADFKGPALMMAGERERFARKTVRALARLLKGARVKIIPESGHGQFLHEQPREYARTLKEFFM